MPRELLMTQNSFAWTDAEGRLITADKSLSCKAKNLLVEGKTFNNIYKMENIKFDNIGTGGSQELKSDDYFYLNKIASDKYCDIVQDLTLLIKPNTIYTLVVDIRTNTLTTSMDFNAEYMNRSWFLENASLPAGTTGRKIYKLTSKSTFLTDVSARPIRTQLSPSVEGILEYKAMLFEGDYTNTYLPTSINGIESVAERESKNLFKDEGWSNKHLNNSNNTLRCSNNFRLPVKLNDVYTINYEANNPNLCLVVNGFKADGSYFIAGLNTDWLYKNQMPYSFKITNPEVKSIGFMLRYKNDETISPTSSDVLNSNITVLPNLYTEGDVNVKGTNSYMNVKKQINVKPNTTYVARVNIESINKGDNNYTPRLQIKKGRTFICETMSSTTFNSGGNTTLDVAMYVNNAYTSTTECEANFKNIAIYENNIYPIKLTNKGKNLLDISTFTPISYSSIRASIDRGVIAVKGLKTADVEAYTDPTACNLKVYLEEGKTYSVSFKSDGKFGVRNGEDTVEIFFMLDGTTTNYFNVAGERTVTIPRGFTGNYYVRFDVNSGDKTHKFWDIQVEEGDTVTDYEPYREPTLTEIPLPQPLRSLPNGVCDEVVGNRLIQRIGKFVIDGTNNITLVTIRDNTLRLFLTDSTIKNVTESDLPFLCDSLPKTTSCWNEDIEGVYQGKQNNRFIISILISKVGGATIEAVRAYFTANPMTIYYELETPIVHDLTIPSIYTEKGTNIITTANNIKPNLYIKYKKSKK